MPAIEYNLFVDDTLNKKTIRSTIILMASIDFKHK